MTRARVTVAVACLFLIPVWPPAPYPLCGSRSRRLVAWAGQYALYLAVGVPLAFAPAGLLTGNRLFGTLKRETTAAERARWPGFQDAKRLDPAPRAQEPWAALAS